MNAVHNAVPAVFRAIADNVRSIKRIVKRLPQIAAVSRAAGIQIVVARAENQGSIRVLQSLDKNAVKLLRVLLGSRVRQIAGISEAV